MQDELEKEASRDTLKKSGDAPVVAASLRDARANPNPYLLELLKGTLTILRHALWPAIVGSALWVFYPHMRPILEELSSKLKSATTLQVGSLSLAVQERARLFGGSELVVKIGTLSPNALSHLLNLGSLGPNTWEVLGVRESEDFVLPSEATIDAYRELETRGLVKGSPINFREYEALLRHAALMPKWPSAAGVRFNPRKGKKDPVPEQRLTLTPAGRLAVATIVEAVAQELGNAPPLTVNVSARKPPPSLGH